MPRVTRRSAAAAKDETTPQESSSRSTSRGRKGAKKEEPAEEEVAVGEPQEMPVKKGRQAAKAKEEKPKAAPKKGRGASRGRSASRGGRGKKQEEPEEDEAEEEEEEEEEEEKPQKGGAKGKGSGKGAKSSARGGRSSSRGTKGKAAEPEEEEEEEEEEGETFVAVKGRGGRSRGRNKPAATTPSPRGSRRGRGKAAAEEEEEDNEEESKEEVEEEKDQPKAATEKETEASPSAKQKHTPTKAAEPAVTPPSGGRRGRGGKAAEVSLKTPLSSEKPKPGDAKTEATTENVTEDKSVTEPMDTNEPVLDDKSEEKVKVSVPQVAEGDNIKKRKLEEVEDEQSVKRAKTDVAAPVVPEEKDVLEGFEVVNKDDVPAADSKEVAASLPPALPVETSKPSTPEDLAQAGVQPIMAAPGVPVVVPLTEAELAKQYTTLQKQDRDETSSTLVEVGSEGASDITGVSVRGLDTSDAFSLDSTSMDMLQADGNQDQPMDTSSSNPAPIPVSVGPPVILGTVSSTANAVPAPVATDVTILPQQIISNAAAPTLLITPPPPPVPAVNPVNQAVNTNSNQPTVRPPAPIEVNATHAPIANATTVVPSPASQPQQAPNQNGSVQNPLLVNSSPVLASTPVKPPSPEVHLPSSTAIDSRKFIPNPAFPVEMMDPAFCFSVVTYNILADCHMRRGDYSYTQPQFLEQAYRHTMLLKELDYLDADIVCMQEVNPDYFVQTLLPAMNGRGYEGFIIKRTKDFMDEGEATFVRSSKFKIISQRGISLTELAFQEIDDSGLAPEVAIAAKKYLDRPDVILLTEVCCQKTGKVVTICNIHVVYDKSAPDVQCIQIACAIKQLVAKAGNDLNPHIICGDFNSVVTSPGYQLAKDGYLSDAHIHKLQALEKLDNTDGSSRALINHMWRAFQHTSSNLKSAYETAMGKEPPVTSYTKNTFSTLDYIFHSAASLDTVGVFETLDKKVVEASGGLPSNSIPSDHLSLKAVFRLKD